MTPNDADVERSHRIVTEFRGWASGLQGRNHELQGPRLGRPKPSARRRCRRARDPRDEAICSLRSASRKGSTMICIVRGSGWSRHEGVHNTELRPTSAAVRNPWLGFRLARSE
jgi:hypothetical protein